MRKLTLCGLVAALAAVFGGLLVGSPVLDTVAEGQRDYVPAGERVVRLWHSGDRYVEAEVGLHVRATEGRPTGYRSHVELRCLLRGLDNIWRPNACAANFGQRLVRGQSTVTESWSELASDDSGVIVSTGDWMPVTCRGLYTAELVAFQVGVAGEVHTIAGEGLFPSFGLWADC